ncbi:hypothetical protein MPTK1_4g15930 [Marchantia polymorpha subsp. ruderalis]|uniref:Uncharacterized protein n=2 Tax=Marchantia polymorpha TaxID=3197 RepID=A0AAF6BAC6_MARPO|nr:hypothetical protein MARPO_0054s0058 [Marchantia polymorpha]BBN08960.1 hypothetical protein Mp_4g15930 [Marchantia polymorpha subsp. ruderalis]|eukprot:PTQ37946.1 hypothetical protein MARPO_0054s0058 [Marchantia polymorpha]
MEVFAHREDTFQEPLSARFLQALKHRYRASTRRSPRCDGSERASEIQGKVSKMKKNLVGHQLQQYVQRHLATSVLQEKSHELERVKLGSDGCPGNACKVLYSRFLLVVRDDTYTCEDSHI